ncbi:MAG: ATP-dependent DNA helicase RecG [Chloroflexi bacterium]|nr:ATP-dependent DNA helicase RecG [Chloroflexota bacterium]
MTGPGPTAAGDPAMGDGPDPAFRIQRKLEAIRRILSHEQTRGFADDAVIGGIDRFLERWVEDPDVSPTVDLARAGMTSYEQLSRHERAEWVTGALLRIGPAQSTSWSPRTPGQPSTGTGAQLVPPPRPALDAEQGPSPAQLRRGTSGRRTPATRPQPRAVPRAGTTNPTGVATRTSRPAAASAPPPIQVLSSLETDLRVPARLVTPLRTLGIRTYRDALWAFPRRYLTIVPIAQLVPGREQAIAVTIFRSNTRQIGRRQMQTTEAVVGDDSGTIQAVWFGRSWIGRSLTPGKRFLLTGRLSEFRDTLRFSVATEDAIAIDDPTATGDLVPIYSLTKGITQKGMRGIVQPAATRALPLVGDHLPQSILQSTRLPDLRDALGTLHRPADADQESRARRRVAFEIGLLERRRTQQRELGVAIPTNRSVLERFAVGLPFTLTKDQRQSLDDVLADMGRSAPMMRLLQGDVGSGKTVVAVTALLMAAAHGFQGALMAPTEVLAEQHMRTLTSLLSRGERGTDDGGRYRGFSGLLEGRPLRIALLTGSMTAGTKDSLQRLIAAGGVDIAIGTHALIQAGVLFSNLGLAVVDEQHRFGVQQRASLRNKGFAPHLLVMTATPIPRTLALGMYGDLDISTIHELPPGRAPIETRALMPNERDSAYRLIRTQVAEGRQAFIIFPLVEESEVIDARAAVAEHERLSSEVFADLRVGLLHGRMSPRDKDAVMERFHAGELDILVSTAVVEVGIDVPNATVMMVEGAERFGLAQLHQYRGRVGRGSYQSYCILMSESTVREAQERLEIVASTRDGFKLAEEDLRIRGPGEFFGTRQSGLPDLDAALLGDLSLLEEARNAALRLVESDPEMARPEHQALRMEVRRFWQRAGEAPAVGGG